MTTSVDNPDYVNRFLAQQSHAHNVASRRNESNYPSGSSTSRSSGSNRDIRVRAGFHVQPSTHSSSQRDRDASRQRLQAAAAATALGHGIAPELNGAAAAASASINATELDGSSRTWDQMTIRELEDVRQPRRYFSQRIRRVVYGNGNYWSAPMRTQAQRARGMTEDSVTVKAVDRKLLPVAELIKRIEEQQAILAAQAEEARMAPIRAKNRLLRMQRRGMDEPEGSDEDDDAALDADHIDLMSLLDHQTLHLLKQEFSAREKALSMQEFVEVMRRYLPDSLGEVALTANLVKFFQSVDVNGDGTMEWTEFTNFITDAGMASSSSMPGGPGAGAGAGSGPDGVGSRNEIVEEYRKSAITDEFEWNQPLEKLFYFDPLDHLITFQTGAKAFQVFRGKKLTHLCTVPSIGGTSSDGGSGSGGGTIPPGKGAYRSAVASSSTSGLPPKGHTSELLSLEYIPRWNWVVSSANDRTMRFWDPSDHYRSVRNTTVLSDQTQICMRWANQQGLLFSSTDQKNIKAWKIEKASNVNAAGGGGVGGVGGKDQLQQNRDGTHGSFITSSASNTNKLHHYSIDCVSTFSGQNDITLDLLVLDNMSSLASANLDTTIALFDINTHQKSSTLKGGHSRGVFQLAYHPSYHVLLSAGFESSGARVWNPYVSQQICTLKGHYSPLVGIASVPNSPQLLTADQGGVIKLWDIRTFSCVQTLYVEDKESRVEQLNAFVALTPHKRIVSCSYKLFVHDSLTSSSFQAPQITDLEPTAKLKYNTNTGQFLSASGTTVKTWNASNGILERVFRQLVPEGIEITTLCLDDSQKKFLLGDTSGTVRVYNALNGACMKSLYLPGAREITGLEYVPQLKNILCTAWDGSILLLDETQEEGLAIIKPLKSASVNLSANANATAVGSQIGQRPPVISNPGSEIITSCYSSTLTLFATGSSSGLVQLWDFRSHVSVGELSGHSTEITAMTFLDPYPLLATADNEGNVCLWVVRPLVLNIGKCVLRLVNTVKGRPVGAPDQTTSSNTSTWGGQKKSTPLAAQEICPITAMAFWCNIDARSYIAWMNGDPGIPAPQAPFALLYGGDVNGVIRCWDLWPAINQRWKMLPFFTHDRLIPTGKEFDPQDAMQGEEDPNALTEAEKRRVQKQIQANGLAAGGGTGNQGSQAAGRRNVGGDGTEQTDDNEELNGVSTLSPSNSSITPGPARLSLPAIVSNLVQANLSSYTSRSAAILKAQEVASTLGTGSVEYEAALAAIPGATAAHWAAVQKQRKAREIVEQREEERKQQEAQAKKTARQASMSDLSGSNTTDAASQRRRAMIIAAAMEEEEKSNLTGGGTDTDANGKPKHFRQPTMAVQTGTTEPVAPTQTRTLSLKLSNLASATGPAVSNSFSRGTAKLFKSSGKKIDPTGGAGGVLSSLTGSGAEKKGGEEDPFASGNVVDPVLSALPSIPLLPLSLLNNPDAASLSASFGSVSDQSAFMPKSVLRHSRTNDYVEYRRVHRELMNDLERHARNRTTMLQPGDIKLVQWWIAHTDSIRDLTIVREDPVHKRGMLVPPATSADPNRIEALASCSFDKKVCLWTRSGSTLGHLQQGRTEDILASYGIIDPSLPTTTNPPNTSSRYNSSAVPNANQPLKPDWTFQSDVRGRYQRSQDTARKVLQRLNTARTNSSSQSSRLPTARKSRSRVGGRKAGTADGGDFSDLSDDDFDSDLLLDSDADDQAGGTTTKGDTFLTELDDLLGFSMPLGEPKLSSRSQINEPPVQPQLKNLNARSRTSRQQNATNATFSGAKTSR